MEKMRRITTTTTVKIKLYSFLGKIRKKQNCIKISPIVKLISVTKYFKIRATITDNHLTLTYLIDRTFNRTSFYSRF